MTETFCGLCQANGLKRQLVLFQLNLEEAILLCENKQCVYPLGVTDNAANLIVSRKASEVMSLNLKRKRKNKTKQAQTEEPENVFPESTSWGSFLQWQNVDSLCWLDSLLSLVVHNSTLATYIKILPQNVNSLLRTLTESFNKAQELSSVNREQSEQTLHHIREDVWNYLQPKMKCERGVNDSPVTALPLLLRENSTVSEKMLHVYQWEFNCTACGYQQVNKRKKHMATFPNVAKDFSLQNLSFTRPCYKCGAAEQTSQLVYERMPDCIFLHFEQGLNLETFQDLDHKVENGCYVMSQFIQYKRNPDHFICWIRDSKGKRWMELDDLKSPVCCWSSSPPNISPSEVHIAVWEKVSTVSHPVLTPTATATKESNKTELKTSFKDKLEDVKTSKSSFVSVLNIDCNTPITPCKDVNKGLVSPPLRSQMFPPFKRTSSSSSLVLPQKTRAGQFEPYIPRKKRLVVQSCPNSPLCHDTDRSLSPVPSPKLPPPFLTWQDVREQNKKIAADDLQSDSGYASPASVSSCGSLPSGQSNHGISLNDNLEHFHEKSDENGNLEESLTCNDFSSEICSSHTTNTDLLHEVDSIDLADKLEQMLPDSLLENPRVLKHPTSSNAMETELEDLVKLSAEQDQFILDLLAV